MRNPAEQRLYNRGFLGVENVRPDFDDGMGTSLVIAHTEKAKEFWKEIEKDARWFACQKEDVLQPRLREPTKAAGHRKLFMELPNVFIHCHIMPRVGALGAQFAVNLRTTPTPGLLCAAGTVPWESRMRTGDKVSTLKELSSQGRDNQIIL